MSQSKEESRGKAAKLLLIGLDGFMMELIRKFVDEGRMPVMAGLMKRGAWGKAWPSMPIDTPTNWTTIATGAGPATHGKTSFYVRIPDRELNDFDIEESWLSTLCTAETLWEAAERQGRNAVVVNYPVGWPSTLSRGVVVGGRGVFGNPEQTLAGPVQWSSEPTKFETAMPVRAALGWTGLPEASSQVIEAKISAGEGGEKLSWTGGGQLRLGEREALQTPEASEYDIALISGGAGKPDRMLLCIGKDASRPIAVLEAGQWTDWIYAEYETAEEPAGAKVSASAQSGACRYKLVELSAEEARIRLYRTPIVAIQAPFTSPESLTGEIVGEIGPYIRGLDSYYHPKLWGDAATEQDHIRMGVTQCVNLTNYLARTVPWEMLLTQMQFPDHLNHEYVRDIEPEVSGYDPELAQIAWNEYRQGYEQADRFVGEIIAGSADEETLVVVVSDHAAFPVEHNCNNMEKAFIDAGLLRYEKDENGRWHIDWSGTRACPVSGGHNYVWVNLAGRDPHGIVQPGAEYEEVRDEVIELLRGLYHEEAGKHPISVALRREDAMILDQGGERCGDVVYFYEKGYDTDPLPPDPERDPAEGPVFGPWHPLHAGAHSPPFPSTEYSQSSLAAVCFMAGPGVKRGYHREHPIHLKDVAPTVCHLIGIDPPAQSEGCVVHDMLL